MNQDQLAIVIMGICGCGKTTLCEALSRKLGCRYVDPEKHHTLFNIMRMGYCHPLNDEDRWPWLARMRAAIHVALNGNLYAVAGCSALKERYRERLQASGLRVLFVYLELSEQEAIRRLDFRPGHYMKAPMVLSQLKALEVPTDALTLDATLPVEGLCNCILAELGIAAMSAAA